MCVPGSASATLQPSADSLGAGRLAALSPDFGSGITTGASGRAKDAGRHTISGLVMTKRNPLPRKADTLHRPPFVVAIHRLYNGNDKRATRFRYGLLAFDVITIVIFVIDSMVPPLPSVQALDMAIALVLIVDFTARLLIAPNRLKYLINPLSLADVIVILTLLLPFLLENWAFLRVLRSLRLLRSYQVMHDLQRRFPPFRRHRQLIQAILNLAVFVFVVTAFVYVTEKDISPDINTYVDALYFTVTTLTTTGFGDIVLEGDRGRLIAIAIMLAGIGLFLRLVQALFRPEKIEHSCPDCGLLFHDADAVHCKHCGRVLKIESEGM